ncbi:hypothetical protein TSUD_29530 [Trifolium subterraneum]|uniref:Uncharacterized protein n=1 Tax=Trifolium subterraneum TaxID=3900 RepID=A0A2Z6MTL8_TRISU|nr:hypothetical protein TSUD_29530 [Trifolium subterraneum]
MLKETKVGALCPDPRRPRAHSSFKTWTTKFHLQFISCWLLDRIRWWLLVFVWLYDGYGGGDVWWLF